MDEFTTPLMSLARHQHELFTCYIAVGFTEEQALKLLAYWAAAQGTDEEE